VDVDGRVGALGEDVRDDAVLAEGGGGHGGEGGRSAGGRSCQVAGGGREHRVVAARDEHSKAMEEK